MREKYRSDASHTRPNRDPTRNLGAQSTKLNELGPYGLIIDETNKSTVAI